MTHNICEKRRTAASSRGRSGDPLTRLQLLLLLGLTICCWRRRRRRRSRRVKGLPCRGGRGKVVIRGAQPALRLQRQRRGGTGT